MLAKVAYFIFPADFVVHNCDLDFQVLIILGRPFLAKGRALVDIELGKIKFRVNDEQVIFNV